VALSAIELTGFKSFARKTALEFTAPITAIVGPNGSGKSNIAEAFRFVLGEQSMKSLRGKKSEDLIFNGSRGATRANRAGVRVSFDNSKRWLDIDFPVIDVERVVHRDALNEYRINDSGVRLRDVHELLAGANVGVSNHHIISQGEADRILAVNAQERKEMLEDALGLRIYHYKKRDALKKCEQTEANLAQVEADRREMLPQLRTLRAQVERIERAEKLTRELANFAGNYLARWRTYLNTQAQHLEAREQELSKALADLPVIEAPLTSTTTKSTTYQQIESELNQIKTTRQDTEKELRTVEMNIARLEGEISVRQEVTHDEIKMVEVGKVTNFLEELHRATLSEDGDLHTLRQLLHHIRSLAATFRASLSGQAITHDQAEKQVSTLQDKRQTESEKQQKLQQDIANLKQREAEQQTELEKERQLEYQAETKNQVAYLESQSQRRELTQARETVRRQISLLGQEDNDRKQTLARVAILTNRHVLPIEAGDPTEFSDNEPLWLRETNREVERMIIKLEELRVDSSAAILNEYRATEEREAFLTREIADLKNTQAKLNELIADLDTTLDREFRRGIEQINQVFANFFALAFGGGEASLNLVQVPLTEESMNEEESIAGVEIAIQMPHKRIRGLAALSGGERALTSIALLFAIAHINPPPFLILDETDAALDEANSRRYGDLIERLAEKSQLIIITHNRETMSRAGVLYGITMGQDGVSQVLSVKLESALKVAK
jgi:chromosome segregation protein